MASAGEKSSSGKNSFSNESHYLKSGSSVDLGESSTNPAVDVEAQQSNYGKYLQYSKMRDCIRNQWTRWFRVFFYSRRLGDKGYRKVLFIVVAIITSLVTFHYSDTGGIQALTDYGRNATVTAFDEQSLDDLDNQTMSTNQNAYSCFGLDCHAELDKWKVVREKISKSNARVASKKNFGDYDTSELISMQDPKFIATGDFIKDRKFKPAILKNFQSNIESNSGSNKKEMCKKATFSHEIFFSPEVQPIEEDLRALRERLMENDPRFDELFEDVAVDAGKTIEESIRDQWYQFGASAQWLEDYQCYLVFSRTLVTRNGAKGRPAVSLVTAQAFDRNWNEIFGKRIPYIDVTPPDDLDEQLEKIEKEFSIDEHCIGSENEQQLDECLKDVERSKKLLEKEKNKLISKYYMVYPTLIDIPFKVYLGNVWDGPEDPKISIRENEDGRKEPIVFFNMDSKVHGRSMYAVLPHRRFLTSFPLYDVDQSIEGNQKNWSPFYDESDSGNDFTRGYVHLVQSTSPVRIMRCSLDDGACNVTFDAKKVVGESEYQSSLVRGGSGFVRVPPVIPELAGRKLWVGLAKSHLPRCGISSTYYRPSLTVMEEINGTYYFSLFTDALDFNRSVRGWNRDRPNSAAYTNVRSPNSIIAWDVVSQDPDTLKYEDYMQISMSEADELSYVFVLKGVMNYLVESFNEKTVEDDLDWHASDIAPRIDLSASCFIEGLYDQCEDYSKSHPDPIFEKEKLEEEKKKNEEELKHKFEEEKEKLQDKLKKEKEEEYKHKFEEEKKKFEEEKKKFEEKLKKEQEEERKKMREQIRKEIEEQFRKMKEQESEKQKQEASAERNA